MGLRRFLVEPLDLIRGTARGIGLFGEMLHSNSCTSRYQQTQHGDHQMPAEDSR